MVAENNCLFLINYDIFIYLSLSLVPGFRFSCSWLSRPSDGGAIKICSLHKCQWHRTPHATERKLTSSERHAGELRERHEHEKSLQLATSSVAFRGRQRGSCAFDQRLRSGWLSDIAGGIDSRGKKLIFEKYFCYWWRVSPTDVLIKSFRFLFLSCSAQSHNHTLKKILSCEKEIQIYELFIGFEWRQRSIRCWLSIHVAAYAFELNKWYDESQNETEISKLWHCLTTLRADIPHLLNAILSWSSKKVFITAYVEFLQNCTYDLRREQSNCTNCSNTYHI